MTIRAAADGVSLNEVVVRALDGFLNISANVNHSNQVAALVNPKKRVRKKPAG